MQKRGGSDSSGLDAIFKNYTYTIIGGGTLEGGNKDDVFIANSNSSDPSYFFGGLGIDTVDYSHGTRAVVADLTSGTGNNGWQTNHYSGIENLTGSPFQDSLTGDAQDNVIDGAGGGDFLRGAAGNDTYIVYAGDTVIENPNEGTDTVAALVNFTLPANGRARDVRERRSGYWQCPRQLDLRQCSREHVG